MTDIDRVPSVLDVRPFEPSFLPEGTTPDFIWVASPYIDRPKKRVKAIRKWCGEVFRTLSPHSILPYSPVAASGDWGRKFRNWKESEWYRVLGWDLQTRDWAGLIIVTHLFGPNDLKHQWSRGIKLERGIAEGRGIPVLEVDAQSPVAVQRTQIAIWHRRELGLRTASMSIFRDVSLPPAPEDDDA